MGARGLPFKGTNTGNDAMKVQDFGRFDDPLVLFGGIYSNLAALEALRAVIGARPTICTGDIVAYCADAAETVAMVRDMGALVIAGNCERQLAEGADNCGCGFTSGTVCDILSRGWFAHATAQIGEADRRWMGELPDIGLFVQEGRRYAVIHGGATSNNRFLWPSTSDDDFLHEISALEGYIGVVDGIVAGHCGIAFHRQGDRWQWINAGAVGLPPHDGRAETRYAVLSGGDVIFERLDYDIDKTASSMEAAGLTQGYDQTLRTGLWPSEDVLPELLRR